MAVLERTVLLAGNALVSSLGTWTGVADTVVTNNGIASAAQLSAEIKDENAVLKNMVLWQKAIAALGLTQCPFWTAHPPSVAPTVSPPTVSPPTAPAATSPTVPSSALTTAEQQLADRLAANDLHDCVGRPDLEVNGVVAAVNCQSVQSGPTKNPLVVQFADTASATAWFQGNTANFTPGDDCAGGQQIGVWNHAGFNEGPWGCSYVNAQDFRIVSVAYTPLIGLIADGTSGSVMYSWWENWGYVLTSGG